MAASTGAVQRTTDDQILAASVDLAASFMSRFMGLMGRRSLAPDAGLWFPGSNSIHMMFMRFPIDAVFLGERAADGSRLVLEVHVGLKPWSGVVWLARGAKVCLELPAGASTAFPVGSSVRYQLDT